jgi:hypothetical protein
MTSFGGTDPNLTAPAPPFIMLNLAPDIGIAFKKAPAIGAATVFSYLTVRYIGMPRGWIYMYSFVLLTFAGYSFVLNKTIYGDNGVFLW